MTAPRITIVGPSHKQCSFNLTTFYALSLGIPIWISRLFSVLIPRVVLYIKLANLFREFKNEKSESFFLLDPIIE